MRNAKFMTSRWRRPSILRRERFAQLFAATDLKEILNENFLKALEARRDALEAKQFKFLGWQLPIFLFLGFSLLNVDVNVSVLGISTASAKSLREVLILLSTTLALASYNISPQLSLIEDVLHAAVMRQGKDNDDLKELLKIRYGLSDLFFIRSFDSDLKVGAPQWTVFVLWALAGLILVLMLVVVVGTVQVMILIEIYQHPNFSRVASIFVIAFAIIGDFFTFTAWLSRKALQPYQTDEDLRKLSRLRDSDKAAYDAVIEDMVRRHRQKGLIRRLLGRPTLPRLS